MAAGSQNAPSAAPGPAIAYLPTPRDRIIHWVPLWQVRDWADLGWIVPRSYCAMPHHEAYSITMEWLCDCFPVRPKKD